VAPRCANTVDQIKRDHRDILADIRALEARARRGDDAGQIKDVREEAMGLLQALARHRQRGADLIYEAYSVDIEGGD
jgi:hypothetical protein